MPLLAHPVGRAFRLHRSPVEHARLTDRKVGHIDHLLHFAVAFGFDLADFERNQRAELIFFLPQRLPDQAHELSAFGGRHHAPAAKHFKRLFRNVLVIIGRAGTYRGDHFTCCRVDGLEQRAGDLVRPALFSNAATGVDRLNSEILEGGLNGTHRKQAPNSLARKSFSRIESWVMNPWYRDGWLSIRSMTQQTLEAVVTSMADHSFPLMHCG